jgi:hypothetical protein
LTGAYALQDHRGGLATRSGIRFLLAAALAGAIALGSPAAASAQGGALLDGSPLNVFADGLGAIQVRQDGVAPGLFYDPDENPGHAGLEIKEGDAYYPLIQEFTTAPGRVSAELITITPQGDGSQLMHTAYTIGPHLRVSEDISYTNGSSFVVIHYGIQNVSGDAVSLRAGALADLYVGNNDSGNGAISNQAPRFVGGRDELSGLVYGLQEITPWRSFQEGDFESVFDNFSDTGLNNTVDSAAPDNGVGVDFALDLGPGETKGIDVKWLLAAPAPPGTITPPPLSGSGGDTPSVVKTGDPKLDALPPPVAGKTVNVGVRKGRIFIKIPPSKKFVELKDPMQIPVGATIDARKGRVNLVSAADKQGSTQLAWFYEGVFKIGQDKGAKPTTTLSLAEALASCSKSKASSAAAKKKSRKLWGEGKGNFATKGRYSSGTIRGTRWLVQDTCAGTLTKVAQGTVLVRDFKRKKNVIVRAGKQYLARR